MSAWLQFFPGHISKSFTVVVIYVVLLEACCLLNGMDSGTGRSECLARAESGKSTRVPEAQVPL